MPGQSIPVLAGSALLARAQTLNVLRYAGQHSLPMYLAFFLPMAAMRTVLIKSGWIGNIDAAGLLITSIAIATPLAMRYASQGTLLKFLFERPPGWRLGAPLLLARPEHRNAAAAE